MRVIKDSFIYITGEIISKSIPFLLLPYLARKLGSEGYGELSYYQAYAAVFILIVGLSQDGAVARYFYTKGKENIDIIIRAGYVYSSVIGTIIFTICYIFRSTILMYIALTVIFTSFINVQLSLKQCQKKTVSYTLIQLLSSVIGVVFTVVLLEVFNENLVEKRIIANLITGIIVFCLSYGFYLKKEYGNKKKNYSILEYKSAFIYIFAFGLPLLLHQSSKILKGQADKFLIYYTYTENQLGIYSMAANVAMIASVLIMAINKACVPYYFESLQNKNLTLEKINRYTVYSLVLIPFLLGIVYAIPEPLFLWVLGNDFIGIKSLFIIFFLSALLIIPSLLQVNYLFYYGETKKIAISSIVSTCIYVMAVYFLLDSLSLLPLANVIAEISVILLLCLQTRSINKGK